MRVRHSAFFWPRRARREGRGQLLLSVALGLGLALFFIHQFDAALRPQLVALAEARVRNQVTHIADHAVSQALGDQALAYTDMVNLRTQETGQIATLSTDTVRLNLLRAEVLDRIVDQVEELDSHSLGVPLGALTGVDLFSALGPDLPVQVLSVASAEGNYRNDFTSAGVNQTLHRILLDVSVTARLLLPGGVVETQVSTPVCVAETVIIGQPPQTYLNWNQ